MMDKKKYNALLMAIIDAKFAEIMQGKKEGSKHLNYADAFTFSTALANFFNKRLHFVPEELEAISKYCEIQMSPTYFVRRGRLKGILGVEVVTFGSAMMAKGVIMNTRWGTGISRSFRRSFSGVSLFESFGWIIVGGLLLGVTGVMTFTSSKEQYTEEFLTGLKRITSLVLDNIWIRYGEQLEQSEEKNERTDPGGS